jgi:hypothetical protein
MINKEIVRENVDMTIVSQKLFYKNPAKYVYYPDYSVYKRLLSIRDNINTGEEKNILNFINKIKSSKRNIGAFYKVNFIII